MVMQESFINVLFFSFILTLRVPLFRFSLHSFVFIPSPLDYILYFPSAHSSSFLLFTLSVLLPGYFMRRRYNLWFLPKYPAVVWDPATLSNFCVSTRLVFAFPVLLHDCCFQFLCDCPATICNSCVSTRLVFTISVLVPRQYLQFLC